MIRKKLFKWLLLYYEGKISKMKLAQNLCLEFSELKIYLEKLEEIIVNNYKESMKKKNLVKEKE